MRTPSESRSAFAAYHPLVNACFFAYAILLPLFVLQPAFLAVSFGAAAAYHVAMRGRGGMRFLFAFVLPLMLLAAALNPLLNHRGATALFRFRYNAFTLEALVYGACMALMLGSVLLWFSCAAKVFSTDKYFCLFGRVLPAISLTLCMAFRFLPRYRNQAARINAARRGIGLDTGSGSLTGRVRTGGKHLSILTTWALENAIDTADSMRARGYGLPGRTAYMPWRITARDAVFLCGILVCGVLVAAGFLTKAVSFGFFPRLSFPAVAPFFPLALAAHGVLCLTPLAVEAGGRCQ
jgi:energy-coupling factor transport system permease protein